MHPAPIPADVVILDDHADKYISRLQPMFPQIRIVGAGDAEQATEVIGGAFAFFALSPAITDEVVSAAPKLRWIQALTSGVETFDTLQTLPPDTILTSARGIHGPQVSEMALLHMLSLARDLPGMLENQKARRWERWAQPALWGRLVTIVGLGLIAEDLAARCVALGMVVYGVTATPRHAANITRVFHRDAIAEAVSEADFVVVLAPRTAETFHLIDSTVLAAMRPTAYLVNVARGGVVDESALLSALERGVIAGAGMDVFEVEPLPTDHPMWGAPRTLITPHVGGMSDTYEQQVLPVLEHNLAAYLRGDFDGMCNRVQRSFRAEHVQPFSEAVGAAR